MYFPRVLYWVYMHKYTFVETFFIFLFFVSCFFQSQQPSDQSASGISNGFHSDEYVTVQSRYAV